MNNNFRVNEIKQFKQASIHENEHSDNCYSYETFPQNTNKIVAQHVKLNSPETESFSRDKQTYFVT